MTVPALKKLTFIGTNAAALLIAETLTLDGTVSAHADCTARLPGPGGHAGAAMHDAPGLGPHGGKQGGTGNNGTTSLCGGSGAGGVALGGASSDGTSSTGSVCTATSELGGVLARDNSSMTVQMKNSTH